MTELKTLFSYETDPELIRRQSTVFFHLVHRYSDSKLLFSEEELEKRRAYAPVVAGLMWVLDNAAHRNPTVTDFLHDFVWARAVLESNVTKK